MRAMLIGLTLATAAALAVPASTPATAEGFHVDGPGVSVGVGVPRHRHYDRHYYSERPRVRVYDSYARGSCRTVTVRHDDGRVRKIRRCD
jgi:hypothetical protein